MFFVVHTLETQQLSVVARSGLSSSCVTWLVCSLEELESVEKKISKNALEKDDSFRKCPGCRTWCFRDNKSNICVYCGDCSKTNGKPYHFCWECCEEWRSRLGAEKCGNDHDSNKIQNYILSTCEEKFIEEVKAPSMRACPKCGQLIEHEDKCKHMDCPCGHSFCFFCLKPQTASDRPCRYTSCTVAPRQTTLSGNVCCVFSPMKHLMLSK